MAFRENASPIQIICTVIPNLVLLPPILQPPYKMRSFSILFGLLAVIVSTVNATALTYKVAAHEKACFFTNVERQGAKVAFYFAVRI